MTDLQIYEEIVRLTRDGEASVLATVVESAGSSPRKAGAKMLVRGDGTIVGSVGGGRVELETLAAAREVLASGAPRTLSFSLTEEQGHVCGGRLLVYVEPTALPPRLIVIGAGHVGPCRTRRRSARSATTARARVSCPRARRRARRSRSSSGRSRTCVPAPRRV